MLDHSADFLCHIFKDIVFLRRVGIRKIIINQSIVKAFILIKVITECGGISAAVKENTFDRFIFIK